MTKAESARINGAKSRGPATHEGRAKSALNAISHGLLARKYTLANESEEGWHALLAVCQEEFRPATPFEHEIVREIAHARWRLERLWATETGLFNMEMDKQSPTLETSWESFDETTRLASAFRSLADESVSLALLSRYETRLRRHFDQAVASLRQHRRKNRPNEPNAAPETALGEL